ncbi:hypothetical protein CspHIS471_0102900 [Cutaneotrichosporon sp. HIS471]|nr:hypothetical protein CspHIS471_0102900 [Cutaneotrichosporon sp. HIS471]
MATSTSNALIQYPPAPIHGQNIPLPDNYKLSTAALAWHKVKSMIRCIGKFFNHTPHLKVTDGILAPPNSPVLGPVQ